MLIHRYLEPLSFLLPGVAGLGIAVVVDQVIKCDAVCKLNSVQARTCWYHHSLNNNYQDILVFPSINFITMLYKVRIIHKGFYEQFSLYAIL